MAEILFEKTFEDIAAESGRSQPSTEKVEAEDDVVQKEPSELKLEQLARVRQSTIPIELLKRQANVSKEAQVIVGEIQLGLVKLRAQITKELQATGWVPNAEE